MTPDSQDYRITDIARRLDGHDLDIRELRSGTQNLHVEVVKLKSSVENLSHDIKETMRVQEDQRRQDFEELQSALSAGKVTGKERITFILVPLLVVLISSFVTILASSGVFSGH